jgi:hypothetical protein
MPRYGYSYVNDKGFIAFLHELSDGEWKAVSIKKYDVEDRLPPSPLLEAPRPVVWKTRATWAIRGLLAAAGITTAEIDRLDAEWDSAQRATDRILAAALEDRDTAVRAAAERLRAALLSGNGTDQTGFALDQEVDFGRNQIQLTKDGPLTADVKTVGLAPHIQRIHEATEALAAGLGRAPGQNRAPARSRQIRDALTACSAAFNAIHDDIEWLLDHTPEGTHREQLRSLHKPFLALLERYPPRSAAAAGAADAGAVGATPGATGGQNPSPPAKG